MTELETRTYVEYKSEYCHFVIISYDVSAPPPPHRQSHFFVSFVRIQEDLENVGVYCSKVMTMMTMIGKIHCSRPPRVVSHHAHLDELVSPRDVSYDISHIRSKIVTCLHEIWISRSRTLV